MVLMQVFTSVHCVEAANYLHRTLLAPNLVYTFIRREEQFGRKTVGYVYVTYTTSQFKVYTVLKLNLFSDIYIKQFDCLFTWHATTILRVYAVCV